MKFATLGALARPPHQCEANQPPQASAADPAHACADAPDAPARPFLALRAAACTRCDQLEGRRGQREPPVPQAARLHTQRCPQTALQAPFQPRAGRWEEVAWYDSGSVAMVLLGTSVAVVGGQSSAG